tara:strand:+ start:578 stop:682 length:105 start_codon:yes stop_codon:yes gene_type:complete
MKIINKVKEAVKKLINKVKDLFKKLKVLVVESRS